ncbi:Proline iminopeptidase isoform 1 [Hibiscus syriacus]|uniref:Proline iminopeptidase isoform 1 n=1 Tax=Hibiscus syriacus TaxID=106335 RepID=A0A6A2YEP3_HIBSY|nr:Proline iminopeptidase isoform 1 [Hibiscus syriacus]
MDNFQINGAGGAEVISDDFYEEIEAPMFVDLAAPDRFRTEHDDRYWFCLRVGCDQKHEEMDSEEIYKNFVLRVMAARSPSVGLRKALCKRDSRSKLECPRSVPAKSSKSRVSKLAMISSISQKMGEANVRARHVAKQSSTTSSVKAAKQSSTKALTTPRNRKALPNPTTFRSVRNPKTTTIALPKDRVVAKALVFHSPKKVVKLKKTVELSSSLRKICAGMKKLEINDGSKKNALGCNNKPLDAPRKQLRGREVKSRVYDSLLCQKQKTQEAKFLKRLQKKNSDKDLTMSEVPICHKPIEKDSVESSSKNPSDSLEQATRKNVKISSPSRSKMTSISESKGDDEINEGSSHEENTKPCSKDIEISEATENDDKENALALKIRVSESNKENATASDENRQLNCATGKPVKKDVLVRHEASKNIQKVGTKVMNKTRKENSTADKGAQGMKYRKPKLTNPKPFRLRTDERGILKEANLEKKHLQAPLKETTFPGPQGGNSLRKRQNVEQTIKTSSSNKSKGSTETKISSGTPQKRNAPMHQKMTVPSLMEKGNHIPSSYRVASSRKKLPRFPKETSNPNDSGTSLVKVSPQRRRHMNISKEPNFHSLHVPKSCTKRVA